MDASVYFKLSDRIDAAQSLEELARIRGDIDAVRPHLIERRALERRIERRERLILPSLVESEVGLLVATGLADLPMPRTDRSPGRRADLGAMAPPLAG